ncbi:MAG: hypothetical protein U0931_31025 [Vulcanimicrobiota bacterium]
MLGKLNQFYQKHIGPGGGDYSRGPGKLQEVAEELPAVAAGAGLGAAVGTVAGFGLGLHNLQQDTVSIVTQRTEYLKPELVGAHYVPEDCTTNYTYDDKGNISGSYETCDPAHFRALEQNRSTGLIEERQKFTHTHSLGPLAGAAIGLGVGTLAGALTGALVQKLADPRATSAAEKRSNRAPWIGAGTGALLGAGAGYAAGSVAQAKNQTIDQLVHTPVTQNTRIGWIPYGSDHRSLRDQLDGNRNLYYTDPNAFSGRREVVEAVPTGAFRDHREISHSYHLTPWAGAALGLGLGAVAGGLTGVAVGVLDKVIASQGPG